MKAKSIIVLFFVMLLAGCSQNPAEPEADPIDTPPPQNTSIVVQKQLPSTYEWDNPVSKRFQASHPDGFSQGFVEFYVNGERIWSIESANKNSIDTTWTHSFDLENTPMDFTADLEVKYNLVDAFKRVEDRNSVEGLETIAVTRSRYTEFPLFVLDRFSKQGLTGHVTFPNKSVVEIIAGEGFVSRDVNILYSSIQAETTRIVAEMNNYPNHSSQLRLTQQGDVRAVLVTPYNHGPFNLEQVHEKFLHSAQHINFASGMVTQRWRPNTTIQPLFYDMSYLDNQTGDFVRSDDKNKITAPGFITNATTALYEVIAMIPEEENISLDIKTESKDKDFEFPRKMDITTTQPYIYHVGLPQAPYFLTQSLRTDQGYIRNALLSHRSGFERPEGFNYPAEVRSDVIENFGIRTSGHGALLIDLDTPEFEYNAFAPLVMNYVYSMPGLSGNVTLHEQNALTGKNGEPITHFPDWVEAW